MTSRGKMSRRPAGDDFDDAGDELPGYQSKAPGQGRHSTRESVRRNHTDDEYDEEPPRASRGGRSTARGGAPAYDPEEDDEPPRASVRSAAKSGRRPYESEEDEPPSRGGRAGNSRALTVRSKANTKGGEEDEVVTVSRYEPFHHSALSDHDYHGLVEVFHATEFQIASWCQRQKIVWDIAKKRPSFDKLLATYPDKKAAWEDWQESEDFAKRQAYLMEMEMQADMNERNERHERRMRMRRARRAQHNATLERQYSW